MNILILEDEKDVAESLVKLFKYSGHSTVIATNGQQGLFLLTVHDFDGALVDLMMPEVNGWQFLERMDKEIPNRKVPVIILSGFSDVLQPSIFHHVPVVTKPYEFDKLLALCERDFSKRK